MIRLVAVALLLAGSPGLARPTAAADAQRLDVWPGTAPGESAAPAEEKVETKPAERITLVSQVARPTLSVFRPQPDRDTGAAVVICPGGGYAVLAWDLEGEEVARWLNSIGVTGIVLKYRVPARPGQPRHAAPLQDAQRALSLVRSKAEQWGLDPRRIGMLGFSAGGNLTALASTQYEQRTYDLLDEADKLSCRPDFAVLVYPAWLNVEGKDQLSPELTVDAQTPPMFLAHAGDDPITVDSSIVMYRALKQAGVPAELHIYATGGHGFGLRPSGHPCSHWPERCEEWLRSQSLLRPRSK